MKKNMKSSKDKMLIEVNEKPLVGQWIILAIQHVFAMFGATILVPILVNGIAGAEVLTIPVALATSGIGTLIYILCTKGKSPVYLGSSFAFIVPLAVGFAAAGTGGIFPGIICVGLVYIFVAIIIKFIGKEWLHKLLPSVVIGPMIMIIGLSLASSAIDQIGIVEGTNIEWQSLVVALVTFIATVISAVIAKGFIRVIPFLIGIAAGYVSAICFGMVDFTAVKEASFFMIPNFILPFRDYAPNAKALISIVPIALVTICEHVGDHTALGSIIGKNLIKDPGLDRTLLGDGIASIVAGALGGPANTTYGENTSVVGMTKVASVWVIGLAAIFAILFSCMGMLTEIFKTIPGPVLGAVSILLYGFIAVNGLKVLIENQVDFNKTKNVVVAATMLVLGLGGAAITIASGNFELAISGMTLAAIVGVILNLALPENE